MRILAISGSLRDGSYNTALLRALREEAPEGVDVDIWQGLKVIPGGPVPQNPAALLGSALASAAPSASTANQSCLTSGVVRVFWPLHKATAIKNGTEKAIRMASSVTASTGLA